MNFFNKPHIADDRLKAEEILREFCEKIRSDVKEFSEKFPIGTLVKVWYKGQAYNTMFCYIISKPQIDITEAVISPENIDAYNEFMRNKDNFNYADVYCVPISNNPDKHAHSTNRSFTLCKNKFVEKTTIEEYRQYLIERHESNIEHYKEEIKRLKNNLREEKNNLRKLSHDVENAITQTKEFVEKELQKRR